MFLIFYVEKNKLKINKHYHHDKKKQLANDDHERFKLWRRNSNKNFTCHKRFGFQNKEKIK